VLMVHHGYRGKQTGKGKVWKSGSICLESVDGSVCRKLPAESAEMQWSYVIYQTDDVNSGGAETERPRCFWMPMIILGKRIFAVINDCMNFMQNYCAPNDC